MWSSCKRSSGTQLATYLNLTLSYSTQTGAAYDENNLSKIPTDVNVLSWCQKHKKFREFQTPFTPRYIRKNPGSMYARVPHAMAQFVLKIEKLSHIIGTAPILEIARAYGLHPRLRLLTRSDI